MTCNDKAAGRVWWLEICSAVGAGINISGALFHTWGRCGPGPVREVNDKN